MSLVVDSYREAAVELRRPFAPAAVKYKVQAQWAGGGLIVAYIDARLVIDRLNLIVPHLWTAAYEGVGANQMWCHLTVDGITRRDVGQGTGKGLVSDALKRAAVHFGIGVSLYAIPQSRMTVAAGQLTARKNKKGEDVFEISAHGLAYLRERYGKWLDAFGREQYGEPLDHGDDPEGTQGDPFEPEELTGSVEEDHEREDEPVGDPPARKPVPAAPRAGSGQVALLKVRATQAGLSESDLLARVREHGADRPEDLTKRGVEELINHFEETA